MIGIGVTTYNRPKVLELWKKQVSKHLPNGAKLHIAEDTFADRRGVAYRKNECLKALSECEHIFLFDDDCFPIKDGWADYYINFNIPHLLYLKETSTIQLIAEGNGIGQYTNCGGVMMYINNAVLKKVGGFGNYGIYGYEHAGYSQRIHKARLIDYPYLSPIGAGEFIYSMDYDNHIPEFNKIHAPSMVNELINVSEYLMIGAECFKKDLDNVYCELK